MDRPRDVSAFGTAISGNIVQFVGLRVNRTPFILAGSHTSKPSPVCRLTCRRKLVELRQALSEGDNTDALERAPALIARRGSQTPRRTSPRKA
jgi:hypothetical protein